MKRNLLLLGLIGSLIGAASSVAVAEPLNYNVVNLSESINHSVARDTLMVVLAVHEQGKDRVQVASNVTRRVNQVLAQIKNNRAFEASLSGRSGYPNSDYVNGKRVDKGWQEQATITVKSQDFEALNKLIAQVQANANVQDLQYTVSDSKRKSFETELTEQAVKRFRERAQMITRAMGGSGYRIVNMDIGSTGGSRPMGGQAYDRMKLAAASADAPVPEAMPGNEDINLNISGSIQVQGL